MIEKIQLTSALFLVITVLIMSSSEYKPGWAANCIVTVFILSVAIFMNTTLIAIWR